MTLLLDENLSPALARALREQGHDAVSVFDLGLCGAPDEKIRETAIKTDRILVTLDADFANIYRYPAKKLLESSGCGFIQLLSREFASSFGLHSIS